MVGFVKVDPIKMSPLIRYQNKLECFCVTKIFGQVKYFGTVTPSGARLGYWSLYRTMLKMFAKEKRSSLFCMIVSEEKVPDIDHRLKEYSSEKR
jgi:hypothetical protein